MNISSTNKLKITSAAFTKEHMIVDKKKSTIYLTNCEVTRPCRKYGSKSYMVSLRSIQRSKYPNTNKNESFQRVPKDYNVNSII